jgi:hypothetical protein
MTRGLLVNSCPPEIHEALMMRLNINQIDVSTSHIRSFLDLTNRRPRNYRVGYTGEGTMTYKRHTRNSLIESMGNIPGLYEAARDFCLFNVEFKVNLDRKVRLITSGISINGSLPSFWKVQAYCAYQRSKFFFLIYIILIPSNHMTLLCFV